MVLHKVACPGCKLSLNVAQALPAQLRCPRCQTRFRAAADGTTSWTLDPPRASGLGGRIAALAVIFMGGFLFLALGAGVLVYCLLAPVGKVDTPGIEPPWEGGSTGQKPLP